MKAKETDTGASVKPSIAIANTYSLIAAIYCLSSAVLFYTVVDHTFLAIVHLLGFISVTLNYLLLKFNGNFNRATTIILITGTTVVVCLFATGGWENTGFLWPFAYLPFAYFLTKGKNAIVWMAVLVLGCLVAVILHSLNFIVIPYSPIAISNYFAALFVFAICMYFFQQAMANYEELQRHSEEALHKEILLHKKTAGELVQAKTTAEESNRLKDIFLANMSHEIRTPMNAIIGFTNILLSRNMGDEEKDFVQTIKSSGENLLVIINDILDISKIDAGQMEFESHPLSIQGIFHSLGSMLEQKAAEKKLKLTFTCAPEIPDPLMGDPTRLTQCIVNLTGNAIKFTEQGEINVRADLLSDNPDACVLRFEVRDSGIGIDPEKLVNIFSRFRQAETTTTRKYGGTGLGLSISKQLIELQGGTIGVSSIPGRGSVFYFTLPFPKAQEHKKVIKQKHIESLDTSKLQSLKILLAEDNPVNVKFIRSLFSEKGISFTVAENGQEAIEKLSRERFDIILMDIEMPVMSGYDATSFIRKQLRLDVPIIAMTAHAMAGERDKCLRIGMNDYLSKPINIHLLFEKMYVLTQGGAVVPTISSDPDPETVSDFAYMEDALGGNKELMLDMIEAGLEQIAVDRSEMTEEWNKRNFPMIERLAHRMKSTVGLFGVAGIAQLLEDVRAEALNQHEAGVEELLLTLSSILDQTIGEILVKKKELENQG